jgi:hypothetical protein
VFTVSHGWETAEWVEMKKTARWRSGDASGRCPTAFVARWPVILGDVVEILGEVSAQDRFRSLRYEVVEIIFFEMTLIFDGEIIISVQTSETDGAPSTSVD